MTGHAAQLRGELTGALGASIRVEVAQQIGDLRAAMHRSVGSVTRQMYVALLGQTAVLLGFFYFFVTQLN